MQSIQIDALIPAGKGRVSLIFEDGTKVTLYRSEYRQASSLEGVRELVAGQTIRMSTYEAIVEHIVGLRAKKRAMHLLEQMDRTEWQLRRKLEQNGYPEPSIELALSYVKGYSYVDDFRYACRYIASQQSHKSGERLRADLMGKGVGCDVIERALRETYSADDRQKIAAILDKRHFTSDGSDPNEQRRQAQYLMRRGYRCSDIYAVMRQY
jgi:regulatory protein